MMKKTLDTHTLAFVFNYLNHLIKKYYSLNYINRPCSDLNHKADIYGFCNAFDLRFLISGLFKSKRSIRNQHRFGKQYVNYSRFDLLQCLAKFLHPGILYIKVSAKKHKYISNSRCFSRNIILIYLKLYLKKKLVYALLFIYSINY